MRNTKHDSRTRSHKKKKSRAATKKKKEHYFFKKASEQEAPSHNAARGNWKNLNAMVYRRWAPKPTRIHKNLRKTTEPVVKPKPNTFPRVFFLLNRNAIPVGVCQASQTPLSNRISFFLNLCHRHFDRFKIRRFDFDRFKIRRFDFRPLQNSAIWFP